MKMDRNQKIKEMMVSSCEESKFHQLLYVLEEVLRYQDDKAEFLEDTLTMVDDESIDEAFYRKIYTGEIIIKNEGNIV